MKSELMNSTFEVKFADFNLKEEYVFDGIYVQYSMKK
jgi:hypothetical protein